MSGFDIIIYIAGILLLSKIFFKELISVIQLAKKAAYVAREPLPPAPQPPALPDTRSRRVSDLAVRNNTE